VTFYRWARKLLVRNEFITPAEEQRGVKKKFAISERCCCPQWFCVLTKDGDYECRDVRPEPDTGEQVLSEHKDEKSCQEECYERYYCVDRNKDYQCIREGEVLSSDDVVGGPYRLEECEEQCNNCPPCGNEACEAEAAGDNDIIAACCAALEAEEEWTFNGDTAEWSLTQHCGEDKKTPCSGDATAGFPDNPADGDTVTFPCAPNGNTPRDLPDCTKCLFDCDKNVTPYTCVRAPDAGLYTEKECERECAGLWYCVDHKTCERQNPPKNPAKQGYDTEDECLAQAETECCRPQCSVPPNVCGNDPSLLVVCSNFDCSENDFSGCLDGLTEAQQQQGYKFAHADARDCCQCDDLLIRSVVGCCPGGVDYDPAKSITIPRKDDGDCVWCGSVGEGCVADEEDGQPVWRIFRCSPEPPPPDGYVCQGPFSGIWECAPCNDCAGNPETYATLEECEQACQPPVQECCLVCELPGPPPEQCPDGFFFASNGLCQKYFPTDCSDEQIAEAARQCSAAGGGAVGPPDGPCPPSGCADGKSVWEWQMVTPVESRWTLVWETCTINGCDPFNPPTDIGTFFGERRDMPCLPRGRNPLP
jgi:hypothetical protein